MEQAIMYPVCQIHVWLVFLASSPKNILHGFTYFLSLRIQVCVSVKLKDSHWGFLPRRQYPLLPLTHKPTPLQLTQANFPVYSNLCFTAEQIKRYSVYPGTGPHPDGKGARIPHFCPLPSKLLRPLCFFSQLQFLWPIKRLCLGNNKGLVDFDIYFRIIFPFKYC